MRDLFPFNSAVIKSRDLLVFVTSFCLMLPIYKSVYRLDIWDLEETKDFFFEMEKM